MIPAAGKPVERLTVSRYGLGGLFAPAWDPARSAGPVAGRRRSSSPRASPARIAVNVSELDQFADGHDGQPVRPVHRRAATGAATARIVSGEAAGRALAGNAHARRDGLYPAIMRTAHARDRARHSRARSSHPGSPPPNRCSGGTVTGCCSLASMPWFHPSVAIQRQGATGMLEGDRGDPAGRSAVDRFRDHLPQAQHRYAAPRLCPEAGRDRGSSRPGQGLANTNRLQDILVRQFAAGPQRQRRAGAGAALRRSPPGSIPSIYSHPIGLHGHGAGPSIGFWDNQKADPRGAGRSSPDTAWSIELTTYAAVPEWGGQRADFRAEENAFFDGKRRALYRWTPDQPHPYPDQRRDPQRMAYHQHRPELGGLWPKTC